MKTPAKTFTYRRNYRFQQSERSRTAREALVSLAANSQDACALVTVYDSCRTDLKASAIRWFGRDNEFRKRAVNSILAAIGRQAGSYDPQSMDAAEWVSQVADAEARRLREILYETRRHCGRTRRT